MVDEQRLKEILASVLGVPLEHIGPESSQDNIASWDSLRHMNLVLALEQEFSVALPDEEVVNINSYARIQSLLQQLTA